MCRFLVCVFVTEANKYLTPQTICEKMKAYDKFTEKIYNQKKYKVKGYHLEATVMQLIGANILRLVMGEDKDGKKRDSVCVLALLDGIVPAYMEPNSWNKFSLIE